MSYVQECDTAYKPDDDSDGKPAEKAKSISFHLIVKKHLPKDSASWPQDKVVNALNKITHLRLDREDISEIDNLELFGANLTNIYLQMNRISRIENLECVNTVQFLTLSSNRIQKLEGLSHMEKLVFLDLSNNQIRHLDLDELPRSLSILSMMDNPCTRSDDYRLSIVQALPRLRQLDGKEVTSEEKIQAGFDISSDEEDDDDEEEELHDGNARLSEDIFSMTSANMLLRSQDRMEDSLLEHKDRRSFLRDLRSSSAKPTLGGATRTVSPS